MAQRSTIVFVTGPAGSGKSYRRCAHYLVKEHFGDDGGEAVHLSNFPIQFEPWKDANGVDRPGLVQVMRERGVDEAAVRRRVVVLDEEMVSGWRNDGYRAAWGGKSVDPLGPWSPAPQGLGDEDLTGVHLAIDEIHNFCGKHSSSKIRQRWQQWLGELRHRGATIEFLTQHPAKVADEIEHETEVRYELLNNAERRSYILQIKQWYWDNLIAAFGFGWHPSCWQLEYRQVQGKWPKKPEHEQRFYFNDELYGVYDSFSAPIAGGRAGTTGKRPHQRYGLLRLLWWFAWSNAPQLLIRGSLVLALVLSIVFARHVSAGAMAAFHWLGSDSLSKAKARAGQGGQSPDDAAFDALVGGLEAESPAAAVTETFDWSKLDRRDADELRRIVVERDDMADRLEALEGERGAVRAELAAVRERLDAGFAVAGLTSELVTFRGGYSYAIGETIDFGPYRGQTLEAIDLRRRRCQLSGGVVLRLADDRRDGFGLSNALQSVGRAADSVAELPGSLLSGGGGGDDGEPTPAIKARRKVDDSHKRDAPGRVLPVGGGSDGSILRR